MLFILHSDNKSLTIDSNWFIKFRNIIFKSSTIDGFLQHISIRFTRFVFIEFLINSTKLSDNDNSKNQKQIKLLICNHVSFNISKSNIKTFYFTY